MKVRIIRGEELGNDLAALWANIQAANSNLASPYFHPGFTNAVSSVRRDVEIGIVESDGKVAGFFPFQRDAQVVGKPVGDILSDYHGIISAHNFRFSPVDLLTQCRLVAWNFDHLPAAQSAFEPFHWSREPSPQIDLSCGYKSYIEERRLKHFQQLHKKSRLLKADLGEIRFVSDSGDLAALQTVLAWKSKQYRDTKKPDLFADQAVQQVIQRLFATRVDGCRGILSLLYAGDRLVAGHLGMQSKSVWHYWFPAYDAALSQYSPGLILLMRMAEHAAAVGPAVIDLGKGMSPYKERLMNASCQLASGAVELPTWRSVSRTAWRRWRSHLASSVAGQHLRRARNWIRGEIRT